MNNPNLDQHQIIHLLRATQRCIWCYGSTKQTKRESGTHPPKSFLWLLCDPVYYVIALVSRVDLKQARLLVSEWRAESDSECHHGDQSFGHAIMGHELTFETLNPLKLSWYPIWCAGTTARRVSSSTPIPLTFSTCGERRCCRTRKISGRRGVNRRYVPFHVHTERYSFGSFGFLRRCRSVGYTCGGGARLPSF